MSTIFALWLLLLNGAPDFLDTPPRDLAALLPPEAALAQLGATTDEAGLIALLQAGKPPQVDEAALKKAADALGAAEFAARAAAAETLRNAGDAALPHLRDAAASADPKVRATVQKLLEEIETQARQSAERGDTDYARRLFAIRLLEVRKAKNAMPALRAVAGGEDMTLADAAKQAITVIEGGEVARPPREEGIESIRALLPADAGFVILADLSGGTGLRTLQEYLTGGIESILGEGADVSIVSQMCTSANRGLTDFIAQCGNVRIDTVAVVSSSELGEDGGYVAWLFTGRWDAERMRAGLAGDFHRSFKVGEHEVLYESWGQAFCVMNDHTMVMTVGAPRDGGHMRQFLAGIGAEAERELPSAIAPAFDRVLRDGLKLAASGALSEQQKAGIRQALEPELKERQQGGNGMPGDAVEIDGLAAILAVANTALIAGRLDAEGQIVLTATCDEQEKARELAERMSALDASIRNTIASMMNEMGNAGPNLGDAAREPLWQVDMKDKIVTVSIGNGLAKAILTTMLHPARVQPIPR